MTLASIGNFWATRSGSEYERWLGACLEASYQIKNEAPETENHAARLAWATVLLESSEAEITAKVQEMMRYAIASNATLQAETSTINDAGIQFIVASQINILA